VLAGLILLQPRYNFPLIFTLQLLVALRLLDIVSAGRGLEARRAKLKIRLVSLLLFVAVNVPSLVGCWMAANMCVAAPLVSQITPDLHADF
jgi:hypothetical protein